MDGGFMRDDDDFEARRAALRLGLRAAIGIVVGVLLSGPLAIVLVAVLAPQPPWSDVPTFIAHAHPLQILPYAGGFVLVAACAGLLASLHVLAPARYRVRTTAALVATAAFAAMVLLNYVLQTTFVPMLSRSGDAADAPLVAAFSMANPRSLAWCLEMWGYGFLGVATWLVAPVFAGAPLERAASWTFVANGPASVASAVWTAVQPGWVLTIPGVVAFVVWNVLVVAMAVLAALVLRRRASVEREPPQ